MFYKGIFPTECSVLVVSHGIYNFPVGFKSISFQLSNGYQNCNIPIPYGGQNFNFINVVCIVLNIEIFIFKISLLLGADDEDAHFHHHPASSCGHPMGGQVHRRGYSLPTVCVPHGAAQNKDSAQVLYTP